MIQASNITKTYHNGLLEQTVLRDVSLSVADGEFLAITGRSGAGKSTLLYQLGLLDQPTSGRIVLNKVDVTSLSHDERTRFRLTELGYVFQDYALLPELTAEENVMLPLLMQSLSIVAARKKAEDALIRMGLGARLKNLPSQLSGGEQQRVSIARAIAHKPKIIFADEPTANLDSETSKVVIDSFLQLHKEGETIVMVTHEPEYAKLTDRVTTLRDGAIVSNEKNK